MNQAELWQAVDDYLEDPASTLDYGATINDWDVSRVTDFSRVFDASTIQGVRNPAAATFNEPIGSWDVSSATSMLLMFDGARMFNQDLSSWNVTSVRTMWAMFQDARSFNQDISMWDMSNVERAPWMFAGATSFNQNLAAWNVSSVADAKCMFASWPVNMVDTMSFNQNLCEWRNRLPASVDVTGMFSGGCSEFFGPSHSCPVQTDPILRDGPYCHECNR